MIQGRFHGFVSAKTVGSSGDYSNFVVETLNRTGGDLAFGTKPIENELLVAPEHLGDFLHRFQSAAQGAGAPVIEKRLRPVRGFVFPEMEETSLHFPTPDSSRFA